MSQPQTDLFAAEVLPPTAYILTHLDLYNWGPFGGGTRAEIDPKGTVIIGPTGSGKTTLVDADDPADSPALVQPGLHRWP